MSLWQSETSATLLYRESFDTSSASNDGRFDSLYADHRILNGKLVLFYTTTPDSPPSGIDCVLPASVDTPAVREIEMNFDGAGTEVSNSLFIGYAIGPGHGFALPPFPYGPQANSRTGDRTGYVLRFLRHGDGTNEVLVYRYDTGWIKKLKNEWLPANPVTTLRKIVIRHHGNGEHHITATFDTGVAFERMIEFEDNTYPPNNIQRGLQLVAKAHSRIDGDLEVRTDNWIVQDRLLPAGRPAKKIRIAPIPGLPVKEDPRSADALDLLGRSEMAQENFSDANRHLSMALQIRLEGENPYNAKVAESLIHLAELNGDINPAEAERLYFQAMTIIENTPDSHEQDVAHHLQQFANFYQTQKQYSKAVALYLQTLSILERIDTPGSVAAANTLDHLGKAYLMQRQFDNAEYAYLQALKIYETVLGPDDPKVEPILHQLSMLYNVQGRYAADIPLQTRIIAFRKNLLGPDHTDVATSMIKLASIYYMVGRYDEARPLLEQGLAIKEKALGPNHPDVADALNNLASVYRIQQRFAEAEAMYTRSLAIREKTLGLNSPDAAESLINLALLYQTEGKYSVAETCFRRGLTIKEKILGPDHPKMAVLLEGMAGLYNDMGRTKDADFYARRAGKIRRANPGFK